MDHEQEIDPTCTRVRLGAPLTTTGQPGTWGILCHLSCSFLPVCHPGGATIRRVRRRRKNERADHNPSPSKSLKARNKPEKKWCGQLSTCLAFLQAIHLTNIYWVPTVCHMLFQALRMRMWIREEKSLRPEFMFSGDNVLGLHECRDYVVLALAQSSTLYLDRAQ